MNPVPFKQSNKTLQPPKGYTTDEIGVLPIWTDGGQCVSCWRLSWRERLSALFFGKVWLAVMSGQTQPPVSLEVSRVYFEAQDDN